MLQSYGSGIGLGVQGELLAETNSFGLPWVGKFISCISVAGTNSDLVRMRDDFLKNDKDPLRVKECNNSAVEAGFVKIFLHADLPSVPLFVANIGKNGIVYLRRNSPDTEDPYFRRILISGAGSTFVGVPAYLHEYPSTNAAARQAHRNDFLMADLGAQRREEIQDLIPVGSSAVFEEKGGIINRHIVFGTALGPKLTTYIVAEAIRRIKTSDCSVQVSPYLSTEIQAKPNTRTGSPDCIVRIVPVAVGSARSGVGRRAGQLELGSGPVAYRGLGQSALVFKALAESGRKLGIPLQYCFISDSQSPPRPKDGMRQFRTLNLDLGLPVKYKATPFELVDLDDVGACINLIVDACVNLYQEYRPGSEFSAD